MHYCVPSVVLMPPILLTLSINISPKYALESLLYQNLKVKLISNSSITRLKVTQLLISYREIGKKNQYNMISYFYNKLLTELKKKSQS